MSAQELTNSELAAQLRALADIYEAHPEIRQPHDFSEIGIGMPIYCHDKESFAATVKAFGAGSKFSTKETVAFVPDAIPSVRVTSWHNKICERVVVGTREVPEKVIPPTEGRIIPAHIEEIVEWRCKPFLGTDPAGDRGSEVVL
jgi:hypothetical protein